MVTALSVASLVLLPQPVEGAYETFMTIGAPAGLMGVRITCAEAITWPMVSFSPTVSVVWLGDVVAVNVAPEVVNPAPATAANSQLPRGDVFG